MRGKLFCTHRVLMLLLSSLLSIFSGEIYLRLKPYLVVKISSDIVTKHCCQVCVLSMMFCRSAAVSWHGKWLRNQQESPRSTHVVWLSCGRPTWDIKIFFTFHFHILHQQRHIGARIISCCISIKKDSPCWPRQSKTVSKIVGLR